MRTFGIDVSHWEGSIDWQVAAPTIGFAYFKCTDGIKFVDTQYQKNQTGCAEFGIPHAPYHFFQPCLDPIVQAEHFIDIAGKNFGRYIVDMEVAERDPQITHKLYAFLDRVERLTGVRPAIYTSSGYWNQYIQPKPSWADQYDLIVAHYTRAHAPILPIGWSSYLIWQFTDFWNFPGCTAEADGNWFNGTLQQCRDWFGNYQAVKPPEPSPVMKLSSLFDHLHIRQSPDVHARITGKLSKGEVVEAIELGGNEVWVKHARGWSAVERGGYRYMEIAK